MSNEIGAESATQRETGLQGQPATKQETSLLGQTLLSSTGALAQSASLVPAKAQRSWVIARIDEKIAATGDIRQLTEFVKLRDKLARQENVDADARERRLLARVQTVVAVAVPLALVATGVGLFVTSFTIPGLFILGAGLYHLAPKYVMKYMPSIPIIQGHSSGDD